MEVIGALAKPRAVKRARYVCDNIDAEEVAGVRRCGETERRGRGHKEHVVDGNRSGPDGSLDLTCRRERIGTKSL